MDKVQILSLVVLVAVVVNLILVAMQRISIILFWIILGAAALYSYFILPRIRGN